MDQRRNQKRSKNMIPRKMEVQHKKPHGMQQKHLKTILTQFITLNSDVKKEGTQISTPTLHLKELGN